MSDIPLAEALRGTLAEGLDDDDVVYVHMRMHWPMEHSNTALCWCHPVRLLGPRQVEAFISTLDAETGNPRTTPSA